MLDKCLLIGPWHSLSSFPSNSPQLSLSDSLKEAVWLNSCLFGKVPPVHWAAMAVPTPSRISLQELLTVQGQPVTEGQAWALCYHGCLAIQRQQSPAGIWAGWLMNWKQPLFRTVDDLILNEDGTVVCVSAGNGNIGGNLLAGV